MNPVISKVVPGRRAASRRLSLALAAAAAAALVLTACTPPPTDEAAESPLAVYLSAIYGTDGDEADVQARFADDNRKIEELVAQCMADAGFEYLPNDSSTVVTASGDDWKPDDEDWVAQYGYGVFDYPGRDAAESEQEWEDPNGEYLESLSESEQNAYYETLYGPSIEDEDGEGGGVVIDGGDSADRGCYGAASSEVSGDDPMQSDEFAPLMEAMNVFWNESASAPELAAIDAAWAECMADGGETGFTARAEAQQSIYDELNRYYESQTEFVEDDPALDELQEREVELALADLHCRLQPDYTKKAAKVQYDLELQFIDDHRSELDALKAAVEQGRR